MRNENVNKPQNQQSCQNAVSGSAFTINNKRCFPPCKKNKNCICNKVILYHKISGNTGEFLKYTYPTGKPKTTIIKLDCGNIYFAPSHEFKQV